MQTIAIDLAPDAWTEILSGNNALALQVVTASNVRLHFNASGTAPSLTAPSVLVQSFPPQWDFDCQNQSGQSRVWARSESASAQIVVVRRTI
jgi:hypothetical protein